MLPICECFCLKSFLLCWFSCCSWIFESHAVALFDIAGGKLMLWQQSWPSDLTVGSTDNPRTWTCSSFLEELSGCHFLQQDHLCWWRKRVETNTVWNFGHRPGCGSTVKNALKQQQTCFQPQKNGGNLPFSGNFFPALNEFDENLHPSQCGCDNQNSWVCAASK